MADFNNSLEALKTNLVTMAKAVELLENCLIDGKRNDTTGLIGYGEIEARFAFLMDEAERQALLEAIKVANRVNHGSDKFTDERVIKLLTD